MRLARPAATTSLTATQQILARAKGYPYARPNSSYLYAGTNVYLFQNKLWVAPSEISDLQLQNGLRGIDVLPQNQVSTALLTEDWTPILAIGSNAGPEQLARKFPVDLFPKGVLIPVIECVLEDFDVVYSPGVSSYGSCTATLEYSPGTAVEVYITYLTPELAQRMHETEGAYNLCELNNVRLHEGLSLTAFREGESAARLLNQVYQYNHQEGSLHLPLTHPPGAHTPIALGAIPAINRAFPALCQEDMQKAVRWALETGPADGLAPIDLDLTGSADIAATPSGAAQTNGTGGSWRELDGMDEWILRNVQGTEGVREEFVVRLVKYGAYPFQYKDNRVLQSFGDALSTSVK